MADRDNNLGSPSGSDEEVNPDLGVDENSGMSGSDSDRDDSGLEPDKSGSEPLGDRGPTETTGDELDGSRERGRSGNTGGSQGDSQSDGSKTKKSGFGDPSPSNN